MTLKQIAIAWNNFWFAPESASPVCLYRIFWGLLVAAYGICFTPQALVWFGQHGIVTQAAVEQWQHGPRLSILLWFHLSDSSILALLGAMITAALCVAAGIFTRVSTVICWVLFESFYHRDPLIGNVGDAFIRLSGFILIFAPAGALYSVDRLIGQLTGRVPGKFHAPWAQRLLQFQLALVYFEGFSTKISGARWWDGTAAYFATHLRGFAHLAVPGFADHLIAYQIITWATMLTELSLFTLIWVKELRYWVLLAGIIMHIGIDIFMSLPMLLCVFVSAYINFVEPKRVEDAVSWVAERLRLPARQTNGPEEPALMPDWRRHAISAFIVLFVFSAGAAALPSGITWRSYVLSPFNGAMAALGLNQSFGVFAPGLPENGLDLQAVVEYNDGSTRVWKYPEIDKFGEFDRLFNDRYRKLLYGSMIDNRIFWPGLAAYIARQCNESLRHPTQVALVKFHYPVKVADLLYKPVNAAGSRVQFFKYTVQDNDLADTR